MKLPAKAEYVGVSCLSVSGVASRMGFSYEDIEDLKIALSEAVSNVVEHAYSDDDDGDITSGFGVYENRIEIMVADHGGSFNLQEITNDIGPYIPSEPLDSLSEGALGLFLLH